MTRNQIWIPCAAALLILALAGSAGAVTQDFNAFPAGTVAAGAEPNGGTSPGNLFPDFTLSVTNNGGGPHSAILFDSANPTGGDWDLGTPNQDFSGPGVGFGGEMGQPGENNTAQGNLLIVAEDIIDAGGDNIVDNPDDEGGGGKLRFDFDTRTVVLWIKIIDIDDGEGADVHMFDGVNLVGTASAMDYGENSYQILHLTEYGPFTRMEITFTSSGGLAEIEYRTTTTGTESTSWGSIKNRFR